MTTKAPGATAPTETTPRRSLYELAGDLLAWEALVEEAEGEITPELEALEQEVFGNLEEKVDRIAAFVRQLEVESKEIAAKRQVVLEEAKWLAERGAAKDRKIARLLQLVDAVLTRTGRTSVAGELFTIKRRGNGGVEPLVLLVPEDAVPEKFLRAKTEISIDKDALRQALAAGDADAALVAELQPRGYKVVVA